ATLLRKSILFHETLMWQTMGIVFLHLFSHISATRLDMRFRFSFPQTEIPHLTPIAIVSCYLRHWLRLTLEILLIGSYLPASAATDTLTMIRP
ncbi:hypothetical protein Ciccas_006009, partial [Cichlidogyrus casuarinus]